MTDETPPKFTEIVFSKSPAGFGPWRHVIIFADRPLTMRERLAMLVGGRDPRLIASFEPEDASHDAD